MNTPVITEKHMQALDFAVWHSCDCNTEGPFLEHHAPDCKHRLLHELQAMLTSATPVGYSFPNRGKLGFIGLYDTVEASTELTPVYHVPYAQDNPEIKGGDVKFWHFMYEEMCTIRDCGFQEAYKRLGIEDDDEYRWKWLLLEIDALKSNYDHAVKEIESECDCM